MRKIVFILALILALESEAQIFSPNLIGYAGPGTIFYPHGLYKGSIYNGYANGNGTFYWYDGSFFSGSFYNGLYNGPGVMVSKLYGYISGCWNGGIFVGNCVNANNQYQNIDAVQNEIVRVQRSLPNDQHVISHDPDGYTVTRIEPNTQMGKTLLGRSPD